MASCITSQWVSSAPQIQLTVTESGSTATVAKLSWTLQYIAKSPAATSVAKSYSVVINGSTVKSGTYNINGVTGTKTIASGTVSINKTTASQTISFSCSMAFNLTWSGSYKGTHSASGSISIPAKTSYKITYNANGGSSTPSAQTKWHDTNITLAGAISRTGYTFGGWNTNSAGTGTNYGAGAAYSANASVTLFAKWTAITYKVTFNANGGSGGPTSQTKTYGVNLTLSTAKPSRTNYNFLGWSTSSTATSASYQPGGTYTSNAAITLYAVWQLAYVRPRISGLTVDRCTSNGTAADDGTYARVKFNWACDRSVSSIKIQWKLSSASSYGGNATVSASGTSGSVNQIVGSGSIDGDHTYDFQVIVADSGGSSYATSTLAGIAYIMDILANGKGLAIGKPAETSEVLDSEWAIKEQGKLLTEKYSRKVNLYHSSNVQQDYCATVIGLCNTSATNTNVNSYSIGQLIFHRENGLQNPVMVDIAMEGAYGAAYGINATLRQLGWHTDYTPVPVTFTYNGVTYGGLKVRYADAALKHIEFHGASNFHIFALDYHNTSTGAVLNSEIYNSIKEMPCTGFDLTRLLYVTSYIQTPNLRATGNYGMHFGVANNPELAWLYQAGGSTTGTKWFSPSTDGATLLGASSYRWGQIYSTTSSISSSDRNQKKDFTEFDERYEELFTKLKPQLFKFKDGTSDRKHCGFISQDVEEAMLEVGITDKEFAGFCKDIKQIKMGEDEETGEVFLEDVYDEDGNPVYNYSLRYEEFIALNTHMIQKQRSEIEALNSELSSLKNEIEELKKLLTNNST